MAAKRGKKDLKVGVQQLDNLWEAMVEKHIGEQSLSPSSFGNIIYNSFYNNYRSSFRAQE